MRRLLITGASGFLGAHLCRAAADAYAVFGVGRSRPASCPPGRRFTVDLTDRGAVDALLADVKPDAVIHAAAEANTGTCERHPAETARTNVDAAAHIATGCAAARIPCVFTSTDMVFDGEAAPYAESDLPSPLGVYGQQKAAAEARMRDIYPDVVVCRLPLMYGLGGDAAARNALSATVRNLRAGREMRLFVDEFRTPVDGASGARGVLLALEKAPPLLHLGGRDRLSRYAFGELVAKTFGLSPELIIGCSFRDIADLPAPRPPDISLDSGKAFAWGYDPRRVADALAAFRDNPTNALAAY